MHFTKTKNQQEEPINFYEELFAKKSIENHIDLNKEQIQTEQEPKQNVESTEPIPQEIESVNKSSSSDKYIDLMNQSPVVQKIKQTSKKIKLKYLVTGLLMGLIVNISMSHYQAINTQHLSQKFATGLMYNLSETNDLEQIAKNIYLGMKENGWEPKIKVSNANIFVFELDNGGEFTITKNQDMGSTKFHVEISDFSRTMIKALMIQLEPTKIGGTKNFITSKRYDAAQNKVSFDLEKVGQGLLPTFEGPLTLPSLPSLTKSEPTLTLPPPVISVPISPELEGVLNKQSNFQPTDRLNRTDAALNTYMDAMDNYLAKSSPVDKK